jgi:hypothetical protein
MIESCFDKHWTNWLHYFREKISILLRRTANNRFCLWRKKTTFKYNQDHQDSELIFLSKRRRRSRIYRNLRVLSNFHCEFRFSLFNRFMRFWKRMFHSFEDSFNKKSWTFLRSFLSILSFLFSLIMKMTWSYSRWTRILKIKKRFW